MAKQENEGAEGGSISMPLKLLVAINRFSYRTRLSRGEIDGVEVALNNGDRPAISGVHVDPDARELAATDGHRLVRVPLLFDAFEGTCMVERERDYTVPSWLIEAAAAAIEASEEFPRNARVRIHRDTKTDVVGISLASSTLNKSLCIAGKAILDPFPPVAQVINAFKADGDGDVPPAKLCFDPRFIADVGAVTSALGCKYGVEIVGWGDLRSPLQLEPPDRRGVRFVVMPMMGPDYLRGRAAAETSAVPA